MTRTAAAQQAAASTSLAADRSAAMMPARSHIWTRSPYAAGVVAKMTGSLPLLVCTHAFAQPARTRCGVIRHHASAMTH